MSSRIVEAYQGASRAFLLKDYDAAIDFLSTAIDALAELPRSAPPRWIALLDSDASPGSDSDPSQYEDALQEEDIKRKVLILQSTLLSTVLSSPTLRPSLSYQPRFEYLLNLPAKDLPSALFDIVITFFESSGSHDVDAMSPLLPSRIPPGVAVSLILASLKLHSAKFAKSFCEEWLFNMPSQVESSIDRASQLHDQQSEPDAAINDGEDSTNSESEEHAAPVSSKQAAANTSSSIADLSLSSSSILNSSSTSFMASSAPYDRHCGAVLKSYERLVEVYVLHVLPKLGEWDLAKEFGILSSRLNGGLMRPSKVDALLSQLALEKENASQKVDRKRQLDKQKQLKQKQRQKQMQQQQQLQSASSSRPSSNSNSHNGNQRLSSNDTKASSDATGFAADRDIISESLASNAGPLPTNEHSSEDFTSSSKHQYPRHVTPSSTSSSSSSSSSYSSSHLLPLSFIKNYIQTKFFSTNYSTFQTVIFTLCIIFSFRWARTRYFSSRQPHQQPPTSSLSTSTSSSQSITAYIQRFIFIIFDKLFQTLKMASRISYL